MTTTPRGKHAGAMVETKKLPPGMPIRHASATDGAGVDRYYKVVMAGNSGVGKTSLCNTLDGKIGASTMATIGVDHLSKAYRMEGNTVVMQLWDTHGIERFSALTRGYFQKARAVLLVYAVDDRRSFDAVNERWRRELGEVLPADGSVSVFLVANKTDVEASKWVVTKHEALALCAPLGWFFHETSAMDQKRTDTLFEEVMLAVLNTDNVYVAFGRGKIDSPKVSPREDAIQLAKEVPATHETIVTDSDTQPSGCYC